MMQPIKRFHITSLTVQGFKGYDEPRTFEFKDMNTIIGHMGVGKSSIADAIAFAVTGVPFFGGGRIDTLYHQDTRDLTVDLSFLDEDGKSRRLVRRRVNDNMDVVLDERKITQRDLTLLFGEKDLFLSMFNPLYFIEVLGNKGRDLLERYLPDIPRETILEGLSDKTRQLLERQEFLSAEVYAKKLRDEMNQLERDMTYSQGQLDLLEQQVMEQSASLGAKRKTHETAAASLSELESRRSMGFDGSNLEERRAELYARHEELLREPAESPDTAEIDAEIQKATAAQAARRAETYQSQYAQPLADTQAQIASLSKEVARQKHILSGLQPGVQCPVCRQTVTEDSLPEVRNEFRNSVNELCRQGQGLTARLSDLQELDRKAKETFDQFQADDIAAGEEKLAELAKRREKAVEYAGAANEEHSRQAAELRSEIQNIELDLACGMLSQEEREEYDRLSSTVNELASEIDALNKQLQDTVGRQNDLQDAIAQSKAEQKEKKALLTALASYISRRTELIFSRLRMNRVSISLYEVMKTTGEVRDVFKFNYEGRPYLCLSHSEKIRAGLEVTELVKQLTGVDYPVFIDDSESVPVIDNVRPGGQIFVARVVKGAQLQVQAAEAASSAKAA